MKRPPRNINESLFSLNTIVYSLLQGFILLFVVLGVFLISRKFGGENIDQARGLAFITLIIGNLGLIITNRSWLLNVFQLIKEKNMAMIWVFSGAIVFLFLAIYQPFLSSLLKFGNLHNSDITLCIISGIMCLFFFEILKSFYKIKFQ